MNEMIEIYVDKKKVDMLSFMDELCMALIQLRAGTDVDIIVYAPFFRNMLASSGWMFFGVNIKEERSHGVVYHKIAHKGFFFRILPIDTDVFGPVAIVGENIKVRCIASTTSK